MKRKPKTTSHQTADVRGTTFDGDGQIRDRQIRALVESLPAVVWCLNAETFAFEFVSQGAEAVLGYPAEDWIRNPTFWLDNLHPDDQSWAFAFCRSATKAHRPHEFEYRMLASDGQTVWIRDVVSVVVHEGKPTKLVGVMIDVTKRHESERDRQSVEEQIRSAKRAKAFGELTVGVVHDFNNTLTAMAMHADLLRNSASDRLEVAESLDAIDLAIEQGIGLTKSLLAVSGDIATQKVDMDIRKVVEEARRMVWRVLPKEMTLLVDNQLDPPLWINGDAAKIQQLVLGLVLDARDSMMDGGTLSVGLHPHIQRDSGHRGGQAFARLTISGSSSVDSGGSRAKDSLFSKNETTLATAQNFPNAMEIVENHSGSFFIDSADRGATIQIDFPCVHNPAEADVPSDPETGLAEKVILVAGDDQQVREIVAATLKDAGHHVIPLPDQAALENHFSQSHEAVNLLVLDLNVPEGAAIEFLQRIRAQGHQTPAILVTGSKSLKLDDAPVERTTFVDKPFQMSSLVSLVQSVLEGGVLERGGTEA